MPNIKCCAFSDTHRDNLFDIDKCKHLIIAGDCIDAGRIQESIMLESVADSIMLARQETQLFKDMDAETITYIPGNHDGILEERPELIKELEDDRFEILVCGPSKFVPKLFGFSYTPEFCGWNYMLNSARMKIYVEQIPLDTEILVTHGPVYGRLDVADGHLGCRNLLNRINKLNKLKYHIFGHIHESRGIKEFNINKHKYTAMNVAIGNSRHSKPIYFDI